MDKIVFNRAKYAHISDKDWAAAEADAQRVYWVTFKDLTSRGFSREVVEKFAFEEAEELALGVIPEGEL